MSKHARTSVNEPFRHETRNAPLGNDEFAPLNCCSTWLALSVIISPMDDNCTGICTAARARKTIVKYSPISSPVQLPWVDHSCWIRLGSCIDPSMALTIPLETDLAGPQDSGLLPAFASGQSP